MSDPISITLIKKVPTVTTVGRGLRGYGTLIQVSEGGIIQWRQNYTGAPWNDIIALADLIGPQGDAAHVHIKWHAEASEVLLDTPDAYIGIYADNTAADSTVYADYQWFKYKGDKGDAAPNTIWQYSIDKLTWTDDATGAVYYRQSGDNGTTWSEAIELPSAAALALKVGGNTIYGGTIVSDLNAIVKSGYYTCYGAATGAPSTDTSWFVHHENSNAGTVSAVQTAKSYTQPAKISYRAKISGVWGAWSTPVSTTEIGYLSGLTGNIQAALESINAVTAENRQRISNQESLLTGYNPTGADRVEISTAARSVVLPVNAAEGGLKVAQNGMSLKNLMTNGNFSNGIAGWSLTNGTASVAGDIATLLCNGAGVMQFQSQTFPIYLNHKYYLTALIKATSNKIGISLGAYNAVGLVHSGSGNYERLSLIKTATISSMSTMRIRDERTSGWDPVYARQCMVVDLTAAGLDTYSIAMLDLIAKVYFSDNKSAYTQRLKSVGADGLGLTYQYIEPIVLRRLPDGTRDTIEDGNHIQRVSDDGLSALATPITTNNVATGTLVSYPEGTITLEPVLDDVEFYTDKFSIERTDYPITSIETISIVDIATGECTPLDPATAVVAGDGLSFTHSGLTAGDLVDVTYFWDYDGVYGVNTFSYFDSRLVKKDTANNKFYRAVPSFTNGVLTWTVEEVV